jgi:hypothetical protein
MATRQIIPAVGYARRSTDLQERSLPDQQAFVKPWVAEHGYRMLRWYVDDPISGTSARGRDAFERMMEAAEDGRHLHRRQLGTGLPLQFDSRIHGGHNRHAHGVAGPRASGARH